MNKWRKHEFEERYIPMLNSNDDNEFYETHCLTPLSEDLQILQDTLNGEDVPIEMLQDILKRREAPNQYKNYAWDKIADIREGKRLLTSVEPIYPTGYRILISYIENEELIPKDRITVENAGAAYEWLLTNYPDIIFAKSV